MSSWSQYRERTVHHREIMIVIKEEGNPPTSGGFKLPLTNFGHSPLYLSSSTTPEPTPPSPASSVRR